MNRGSYNQAQMCGRYRLSRRAEILASYFYADMPSTREWIGRPSLLTLRPLRAGEQTAQTCAIAFHKKAGRSQAGSSCIPILRKGFSSAAELVLSPPFHPHSGGAILARCKLGVLVFSRCCHLISDLSSSSSWKWPLREVRVVLKHSKSLCPVHRTLTSKIEIQTGLAEPS